MELHSKFRQTDGLRSKRQCLRISGDWISCKAKPAYYRFASQKLVRTPHPWLKASPNVEKLNRLSFHQSGYRSHPKRRQQPAGGDVKVQVIAKETSGTRDFKMKGRNLCAVIRIWRPMRALVELEQRRKGLQRIKERIEDRIFFRNFRSLVFFDHLSARCFHVGSLAGRRNEVVGEAEVEKHCPEREHRDAHRKGPPRGIAVPD